MVKTKTTFDVVLVKKAKLDGYYDRTTLNSYDTEEEALKDIHERFTDGHGLEVVAQKWAWSGEDEEWVADGSTLLFSR